MSVLRRQEDNVNGSLPASIGFRAGETSLSAFFRNREAPSTLSGTAKTVTELGEGKAAASCGKAVTVNAVYLFIQLYTS